MGKMARETINHILDDLEKTYPEAECALEHESVFQLLVAVMLSAQTTDKSVNSITPILFDEYRDAYAIADADIEDLEQILKRIGMYRTKAKNLKAMCQMLCDKYEGQVPEDYDKLVELPGVGRKTANVVLSVGFGHQRIAVDTHVFRVANRIGLVNEKDVLKTELSLMDNLPEERWSKAHHSLIFHGRNCCHARKPDCDNCSIGEYCKSKNKV